MTIQVLAVDDNRTMRNTITLALKDEGFAGTTAQHDLFRRARRTYWFAAHRPATRTTSSAPQ